MKPKSWPTTNTLQWKESSRPLGHHTDPIIYPVKNCGLKRRSEESLERTTKRSRTSSDPAEGCRYFWREPKSSSAVPYAGLHHSTGSTSSSSGERKKSVVPVSHEGEEKRSQKRKSEEETQESRKRSRKTPSPSEGPSQTATPAYFTDKPGTSSSVHTARPGSRAAFKAKYRELGMLGRGGFGKVYEGYRTSDNMPVAVKHIPQYKVKHTLKFWKNGFKIMPMEVALLLKLKPAEGETSATVTLLDWYDLHNELILVLERPVPCSNMAIYLHNRGFPLSEDEAKIIVNQLVDALIEVHSKGVFHRDIKLDNILIETGSDVPRVHLIDFGCGTYLKKGKYTERKGTLEYLTPEYFQHGWYKAEPTTVWQLGVVVYGMLHGRLPFSHSPGIISGSPAINNSLSIGCQDFIQSCLIKKLKS